MLMMYEARWRWRSTAAFGSPVVPLVNSRMAMSSGSTNGRSSSTGDDASRAVARNSSVVMGLDPVAVVEALHDVGAGDDEARREAADDAVQLVIGQAGS